MAPKKSTKPSDSLDLAHRSKLFFEDYQHLQNSKQNQFQFLSLKEE